MNRPCKYFKCSEDLRDCLECYNGVCDGTGYEGHRRCGCDYCEYHRYEEDTEVCVNSEIKEGMVLVND